jgi:tetratricopeptide (TPR) repeat protein
MERNWLRTRGFRAALALTIVMLTTVVGPVGLAGQDHTDHHADHHAEIGQVSFATSCSPAAHEEFERGMALLHSFWWAPAREAFEHAAQLDPTCAIAHWGTAMVHYDNPLRGVDPSPAALDAGLAALERAMAIGPATERERDYIAALSVLFRDAASIDRQTRALAYEAAMERLYQTYPDDLEAAVFYALALNISAPITDKTFANPLKAVEILDQVFGVHPAHPGVTHYLIHSFDFPPIAQGGLPAAQRYASLAPAIPHAQHMPSHVFTRVGYWHESIRSNQGSRDAAEAALGPPAGRRLSGDELHAMDYMMYAALQLAQDRAAQALVAEVLGRDDEVQQPYALAAIPARWAVERNQWAEAARLQLHPASFPWERAPEAEALTHFARGVGAARSGDAASATQAAGRLAELRDALTAMNQDYWAEEVEIQRVVVQAWAARAAGRNDEALALMQEAARREDASEKHIVTPGRILPARELLGDLLLELGRSAEALAAYEASHVVEPNRFRGYYGAARAAQLAGDAEKARRYFTELLALARDADSTRPELLEAGTFLAPR